MTMLLPPKNEWQITDEAGMIMPYFTHPFLDILKTWNLSESRIFEWGSGYSTLWFARHCKSIVSVEHSEYWAKALRVYAVTMNGQGAGNYVTAAHPSIVHIPTPSNDINNGGVTHDYCHFVNRYDFLFDIVIVDGIYRNQCVMNALKMIKPGGILIYDNWKQASCDIDVSPIEEMLSRYEHYSFKQPDHPDWRTDYWVVN